MIVRVALGMACLGLACSSFAAEEREVHLLTLDPGHFHAALFQKEMLPGVSDDAFVYAPLGPDLIEHLSRIAQCNSRRDNPTHWKLEIHAGPDSLNRMLSERRGSIVVLSGRNADKIGKIRAIVDAKMHVLADKPWIIESSELPDLQAALDSAEKHGVVAYDAMTQRFDVVRILQRELVSDRGIFGQRMSGTQSDPAVYMESLHYLLKEVSGMVNLRPAWFFDIRQQGEGLADVGTHVVDLVQWTLFPDYAIDFREDVQVVAGSRWPVMLTLAQFQRVTGEREFPAFLSQEITGGRLNYYANNSVDYAIRGVHVRLNVKWDFQAAPGTSDSELAIFRSGRSRIELRQGREEKYRPELFVIPNRPEDAADLLASVRKKLATLGARHPGISVEEQPGRFHIVIPDRLRINHEGHFALLTKLFLDYVRHPESVPSWEKPDMLAKYYVTTKGVELARKNPNQNPPGEK